jgi:nitrate/nitrite transport system substrate-binding protein
VRNEPVNGELDMAHVPHGLVYGLQLCPSGPKNEMAVPMNPNHNGQAITLSTTLADQSAVDGAGLARLMAAEKREHTFAQCFPTGTQTTWLCYWGSGTTPTT